MTDVSVLSGSEAIKFLEWLDPKGLHNLVAIDPVTKAVEAQTFDFSADFAKLEAEAWVRGRNTTANLYFSINRPRADARRDSKLRRDEIGAVRAFHVDIDNLDGTPDWDMDCMPSAVVDSGNGQWGFWKLDAPLTIGETDVQTIEAQNRALTGRFHGDTQAHNLDRIARLPGTLNIPNEAKRKKGRVEALARVLSLNAITYAPAEVAAWCAPLSVSQSGVDHTQNGKDVGLISTEAERLQQAIYYLVHEAPESIEGQHGDAALFTAACQLKNIGIDPQPSTQMLVDYYNPLKAEPPWSRDEIAAKVKSAHNNPAVLFGRDTAVSPEVEFEAVETVKPTLPLEWATDATTRDLPERKWLLGKFLARGYLSSIISPPGVGKTTYFAMLAVAVASGRDDICGFPVVERTRVLLWNQEDEADELKRRIRAVMQAFDVRWSDMELDGKPGIVLGSGVDRSLLLAKRGAGGIVAGPDAALIEAFILENGIGAALFDPFVELHAADENNNVEMAAAARAIRTLCVRGNCAGLLAHHTRKPSQANANGYAGDMDASRGAGAVNGVARMVATLFNVDPKTAKEFGIAEAERHRYVRFDDAKNNLALVRSEPMFFKREGVRLVGGKTDDQVGVLRPATELKRRAASGDTIREDVIRFLEDDGGARIWVSEVVEALSSEAFYSDVTEKTLATKIARGFKDAKNTNGWTYLQASKAGVKGRHACFERFRDNENKNDVAES